MKLDESFFAQALKQEPLQTRKYCEFAYLVIKKASPKLLSSQKRLAKNYVTKFATEIYRYAGHSSHKRNALRICLLACYEFHSKTHPNLEEPPAQFPLAKKRTVISENMSLPILQYEIDQLLQDLLDKSATLSDAHRVLMLVFIIAKRCQITAIDTLSALCTAQECDYIIFHDLKIASISLTENHRILVDSVALLALRKLHQVPKFKTLVKNIPDTFKFYIVDKAIAKPLFNEHNISLAQTLQALTFCKKPVALDAFSHYTPLNDSAFINALTGQKFLKESKSKRSKRLIKKSTKYFKEFEQLASLLSNCTNKRYAIDASARSSDARIIADFRSAINQFVISELTQKRNSQSYKILAEAGIKLVKDALSDDTISVTCTLSLAYCVDLMLYGSNIKSVLAMSTILTYLSTITVFSETAWCHEALLSDAQNSVEAIELLTSVVAKSLSDLNALDKQSTVLNFLQYLHQVTKIKFFDAEELDYCGAGIADSRAHYICPSDFDLACETFLTPSISHEKKQYVLFAKLCYSLGLRHTEATLLDVTDISFDLDVLYVTNAIKRKTKASVRRIPLSLLTPALINELQEYAHQRSSEGYKNLFDQHIIDALQSEFLQILRQVANNSKLVIHSLRHSAANNMLFQFYLCCQQQSSLSRRYYFLQHQIFEHEQLNIIAEDIKKQGRTCDSYFPILDTVSTLLGHVSPVVTAYNYLHLLDILFFEVSAKSIDLKTFNALLPTNNYQYELKKQFKSSDLNSPLLEVNVFARAIRNLHDAEQIKSLENSVELKQHQRPLSFNDYIRALHNYKTKPGYTIDNPALLGHFNNQAGSLQTNCYEHIQGRNFKSWMQLFERITSIRPIEVNRNALLALLNSLEIGEVCEKRTLQRYLRALKLLGLYQQSLCIQAGSNASQKQIAEWTQIITAGNHKFSMQIVRNKQNITAITKPINLRWAPWQFLDEILPAAITYVQFLNNEIL